jgi:hypothetical protein
MDRYFLFGKNVTSAYEDGDLEGVIGLMRTEPWDYFVWTKDSSPMELLETYDGFDGYVEMTKDDYNYLIVQP